MVKLFLISLCLHLVIALAFLYQPIALDDMYQYDMLARSLEVGNGFRWYGHADMQVLWPYYSQFLNVQISDFPETGLKTAFRAPGYPFFLAFVYKFASPNFQIPLARVIQAILMATLAPLTALLGMKLNLNGKAMFWSGLAVAFYPLLLAYPVGLASENLYIPLALSSLVLLLYLPKHGNPILIIMAGVLAGLTMLTRSIFSPFIGLAAIWLGKFHPFKTRASALFAVAAFGLCLPWSIRNTQLMGKPAFVENSLGYNLFIGYHPEGDGGFVSRIAIQPMNILSDKERDSKCQAQALNFIKQNPGEAVRRFFIRAGKFLSPEVREFIYFYSNNLIGRLSPLTLVVIYLLLCIPWTLSLNFGLTGLLAIREQPAYWLVLALCFGYALPHLFIISEPRFHLALVPVLVPLAVKGWILISQKSLPMLCKKNATFCILSLTIMFLLLMGLINSLDSYAPLLASNGNRLFLPY